MSSAQKKNTIVNDGTQSTHSIDDVSHDECDAATFRYDCTIRLPNSIPTRRSSDLATADNSATVADADYVPASGTVTFLAGETSHTVTVLVNGDTKFETGEAYV